MPFNIGPTELILVLLVILIVFGVGRLPEVGGALGKGIREFRKSQTPDDDHPKTMEAKEEKKE